jgi:2-methylisocitrate lyase-like PEP mutase family enzyme
MLRVPFTSGAVMPTIDERRKTFRALHERGCFVIPNPWDAGSACYLQQLGFKALASTSAGLAWSLGRPDNGLTREQVLAHLRAIVEATEVPINADYENGFAVEPAGVAESVRLCVATGVAGLSIEDSTGKRDAPLFDFDLAVARIRAAREAIDAAGGGVMLTARSEGFIAGRPDIDETVKRLKAFSAAGADCLYAPGIRTPEQIRAVVAAAAPKPVNLLMGASGDITVETIAPLGVRRISLGGGLARAAWGGLMRAAKPLAEAGRFDGLNDAANGGEINGLFAKK